MFQVAYLFIECILNYIYLIFMATVIQLLLCKLCDYHLLGITSLFG